MLDLEVTNLEEIFFKNIDPFFYLFDGHTFVFVLMFGFVFAFNDELRREYLTESFMMIMTIMFITMAGHLKTILLIKID